MIHALIVAPGGAGPRADAPSVTLLAGSALAASVLQAVGLACGVVPGVAVALRF